MPEISERDWTELKDQVASLSSALATARRRIDDLEDGMADHIGLDWGESLVDANSPHPNISANTIESGGGIIRQDANGMQIDASSDATALFFSEGLKQDPSAATPVAAISGLVSLSSDAASMYLTSVTSVDTALNLELTGDASVGYMDLVRGQLRTSAVISPAQIGANQDDYAPTNLGWSTVLRLSTDASRDITGITGGASGRILFLFNVGGFNIVLKNDVTSTAANRFLFPADITLAPNEGIGIMYDSTSSRWRCFGRY